MTGISPFWLAAAGVVALILLSWLIVIVRRLRAKGPGIITFRTFVRESPALAIIVGICTVGPGALQLFATGLDLWDRLQPGGLQPPTIVKAVNPAPPALTSPEQRPTEHAATPVPSPPPPQSSDTNNTKTAPPPMVATKSKPKKTQEKPEKQQLALNVPVVVPPPEPQKSASDIEKESLTVSIKFELQRLNCYRGATDSEWGEEAVSAVNDFNAYGYRRIATEPSAKALPILRSFEKPVCP